MAWLAAVTGEAAKFSTEVVHGHYRANLEPSITIKANGKLGYTPKDFPAAFYLSVTTCSRTWFISLENFLFRNSSDISPSWERKREVSASISTEVFSFFSFFLQGREKLKRYKRGIKTSPRINVIQKRCWKAWRLKVLIELSRWEFFFFFFWSFTTNYSSNVVDQFYRKAFMPLYTVQVGSFIRGRCPPSLYFSL